MRKTLASLFASLVLVLGGIAHAQAAEGDPDPWCADPATGSPCDESAPPLPPLQCNPDGSNDAGEPCEPFCADDGGNPCDPDCQAVAAESAAQVTEQQRKIERQAKIIQRLRHRLAK